MQLCLVIPSLQRTFNVSSIFAGRGRSALGLQQPHASKPQRTLITHHNPTSWSSIKRLDPCDAQPSRGHAAAKAYLIRAETAITCSNYGTQRDPSIERAGVEVNSAGNCVVVLWACHWQSRTDSYQSSRRPPTANLSQRKRYATTAAFKFQEQTF